jgi:hypothetical protein
MKSLLAFAALVLASCSSGVVPTGPNSYMISKSVHGFSSGAAGKADVYREASAWCAEKGLVMVPITSASRDPVAGRGMGSAEVHFKALPPGDPGIGAANIDKPDTIKRIEVR